MTQWGLDTLFNPAKRHMDEEKRRLQSTREEVGDNSGGKRIDFDAGTVVIRRDDEAGAADDTDDTDEPAEGAATTAARPARPIPSDETEAQRRARERRARKRAGG